MKDTFCLSMQIKYFCNWKPLINIFSGRNKVFWELGISPIHSVMKEQVNQMSEYAINGSRRAIQSASHWSSPLQESLCQEVMNIYENKITWHFCAMYFYLFLNISEQSIVENKQKNIQKTWMFPHSQIFAFSLFQNEFSISSYLQNHIYYIYYIEYNLCRTNISCSTNWPTKLKVYKKKKTQLC